MAGVTAQGATFTFSGISALAVGISVEAPTAEVADMSGMYTPRQQSVLVPTGALAASGTISVDFLATPTASADWQEHVGRHGRLSFASEHHTVTRQVLLESATSDARAGELVRGSLRFRMTDYYG